MCVLQMRVQQQTELCSCTNFSYLLQSTEKKIKTIFCSCSYEIHKQMKTTTTKASDEYSV